MVVLEKCGLGEGWMDGLMGGGSRSSPPRSSPSTRHDGRTLSRPVPAFVVRAVIVMPRRSAASGYGIVSLACRMVSVLSHLVGPCCILARCPNRAIRGWTSGTLWALQDPLVQGHRAGRGLYSVA